VIPAAVAVAAVTVWVVWVYNGFIKLQQRAHQAWSDIDAQLKRRHDLVPALVETVKGYAGHEKRTLEETVKRRSAAVVMQGSEWDAANRTERENLLARSLRGLFALAEAYPGPQGEPAVRGPAATARRHRERPAARPSLLQRRGPRPQHGPHQVSQPPDRPLLRLPHPRFLRARQPTRAPGRGG
jgi:hypothetical protein